MLAATKEEKLHRISVIQSLLAAVRSNRMIRLPDFDPDLSRPSDEFALVSVGIEPNPFGGTVGEFRYQFEGEEDLLHLIVVRKDMGEIDTAEAQSVTQFLMPKVPPALMWLRSGTRSHHFYLGHDVLVEFEP